MNTAHATTTVPPNRRTKLSKRWIAWLGIVGSLAVGALPGSLPADPPVRASVTDGGNSEWAVHQWIDRGFQEDPLRWTYLASPGRQDLESADSEPGFPTVLDEERMSPFAIDFRERSITEVTTKIQPPSPHVPPDVARGKLDLLADVSYEAVLQREWVGLRYCWDAPVFAHQPLYFEEVNLERYGYGPRHLRVVQPVLSGAHFFATVPVLPYHLGATPVRQSVYALGHYRPGSPAPYRFHYPPLSIRGGLAQAGVMIGLIGVIP